MNGSLTQKCQHLINFGDEFLKGNLIGKTAQVLKQVKSNLLRLGSKTDIDAKIQTARDAKAIQDKDAREAAEKEAKKGLFSEEKFTEKVSGQKDEQGKTVPMDFKTPEINFEALTQKELYRMMRMKHLEISHGMTNKEMVKALKKEAEESTKKKNDEDAAKAAAKNEPASDPKKVPQTTNVGATTYPDKPGITQEAMPYLQGIEMNLVNPNGCGSIASARSRMILAA